MLVIPIMRPDVDWHNFVRSAYEFTGQSPTASVDNTRMVAGSLQSLVAALGEFHESGVDPWGLPKRKVLDHIPLSFLCNTSHEAYEAILTETRGQLSILSSSSSKARKMTFIISGTLKHWSDEIITHLQLPTSPYLHEFFSLVYGTLARSGLEHLFSQWTKEIHSDGRVIFKRK